MLKHNAWQLLKKHFDQILLLFFKNYQAQMSIYEHNLTYIESCEFSVKVY